jgi:hypothetical protein
VKSYFVRVKQGQFEFIFLAIYKSTARCDFRWTSQSFLRHPLIEQGGPMNGAQLHLAINHVSLFALVIGAILLAVSMKRKSPELRVVASVLFVVAGVFAFFTFESGESAADIVKTLGLNTDSFVDEHAMAADWALRSGILVAILALVMEWAACKKQKWFKPLQWILLIVAIHGCTVFARVAYLGGHIRHTEVRDSK